MHELKVSNRFIDLNNFYDKCGHQYNRGEYYTQGISNPSEVIMSKSNMVKTAQNYIQESTPNWSGGRIHAE
jgi:hypothetical protein